MVPGFRKMPEPITPPTTKVIVVNKPREGSKPGVIGRGRAAGGSVAGILEALSRWSFPGIRSPFKGRFSLADA